MRPDAYGRQGVYAPWRRRRKAGYSLELLSRAIF